MGGAGVQIVETRIFWEVLWWKHLHMKNMLKTNGKTRKTKSSDPCPLPGHSPDLAHGSELFFWCFFGFLEVLAKLQKTMETPKKQKVQTHVPCHASPQTLPMGLNFFLCVFLVFSRFWPNCKKPWKNQKKQKVQTHVPCQASPQTLSMGLNFLFFLFFQVFFACFSCEDAFITVPLKKRAFLQFAHLRPPGQTAKTHGKTKINLMNYIMPNIMINTMINVFFYSWV